MEINKKLWPKFQNKWKISEQRKRGKAGRSLPPPRAFLRAGGEDGGEGTKRSVGRGRPNTSTNLQTKSNDLKRLEMHPVMMMGNLANEESDGGHRFRPPPATGGRDGDPARAPPPPTEGPWGWMGTERSSSRAYRSRSVKLPQLDTGGAPPRPSSWRRRGGIPRDGPTGRL